MALVKSVLGAGLVAYLKYSGNEATGVFPMFDAISKERLECYQQGWILS